MPNLSSGQDADERLLDLMQWSAASQNAPLKVSKWTQPDIAVPDQHIVVDSTYSWKDGQETTHSGTFRTGATATLCLFLERRAEI